MAVNENLHSFVNSSADVVLLQKAVSMLAEIGSLVVIVKVIIVARYVAQPMVVLAVKRAI